MKETLKNPGEKSSRGKEKRFLDRPVIGSDSKINGGLFRVVGRESTVVDQEKDPNLVEIYQKLLDRRETAKLVRKTDFKDGLIEEIYVLVQETIPFNEKEVIELAKTLKDPEDKIVLSNYFGGGHFRHQTLLAAYIFEKLSEEKRVNGKVSIDRNYSYDAEGPAWVRYTNSSGEVIILDFSQNFIGELKKLNEADQRFYGRPEDLSKVKQLIIKLKSLMRGN